MLYERWRQIATERDREIALSDLASGRRWTFAELWRDGEKHPSSPGSTTFPSGHSPAFILDLLAAWREGKTVCPLEPGQEPPQFPPPPPECVHLKVTSATTGPARLVAFRAAQLAADARNIVATMGLRPDQPNLGVISLAHSYGFSNLILPLLLHGVPLILVPAPLPEMVRRAALACPSVTLAAVPAMWRMWAEAGAMPGNIGLAISAGAPLALKLEREIHAATGLKIHNFYGASECGGIAFDATSAPRTEASLAGSPMHGVELALDAQGRLQVRGEAVGETYWPEASATLAAGVFQAGDLAELRDGLVFLGGRLDDQINVAGRKVSPETIERALLAHPGVRECLVLGLQIPNEPRSETIAAIVASDASELELRQFLLQQIPAWQLPRIWRLEKNLAASARGKLSRAEWRKRILGDAG